MTSYYGQWNIFCEIRTECCNAFEISFWICLSNMDRGKAENQKLIQAVKDLGCYTQRTMIYYLG